MLKYNTKISHVHFDTLECICEKRTDSVKKEAKQRQKETFCCLLSSADRSAADSVQVIHAPLGQNATKTSAQTARQASKTDP